MSKELSKNVNPKDIASQGKLPAAIIPPIARVLCAAVLRKGAELYGPANWRQDPVKRSVYDNAMERHALKYQGGELLDERTGLPHLAHIATNCMILLDAEAAGTLIEDSPYAGVHVTDLINNLSNDLPDETVISTGHTEEPLIAKKMRAAEQVWVTIDSRPTKPKGYVGWVSHTTEDMSHYVLVSGYEEGQNLQDHLDYAHWRAQEEKLPMVSGRDILQQDIPKTDLEILDGIAGLSYNIEERVSEIWVGLTGVDDSDLGLVMIHVRAVAVEYGYTIVINNDLTSAEQ